MRRRAYSQSENAEYIPMAVVTVRAPGAELLAACPVEAMLDTGSTWTFVPQWIADEQQLPDAGEREVGYLGGWSRTYPARWADLRIFGHEVERELVLVYGLDEALIGRNVLHRFAVVFNGPDKEWHVLT